MSKQSDDRAQHPCADPSCPGVACGPGSASGQQDEKAHMRAYVSAWISQLRDLMEQHEDFTGQPVTLIDETGLHYDLGSELDDLANIVLPPGGGAS